jgi:hypothetical protein
LIYRFLKAEIVDAGKPMKPSKGMPQGGVISPLLSNVYLNKFDKFVEGQLKPKYADRRVAKRDGITWMRKKDGGSIGYTRYADDWVILWNGRIEELPVIKDLAKNFLKSELKLELSDEKTKITDVEKGFKFVGFMFKRGYTSNSVKCKVEDGVGAVTRMKYPICSYTESGRRRCVVNITGTFRDASNKGYPIDYTILKVNQIISGFLNHNADITFCAKLESFISWHAKKQMYHYLRRRNVDPYSFRKMIDGKLTFVFGKYKLLGKATRKKDRHSSEKAGRSSTHGSRYLARKKYGVKKGRWFPNDPIVPLNTEWREVRKKILERDGGKCTVCGKTATCVHHTFTKEQAKCDLEIMKLRDKEKYLTSLCVSCHHNKHGTKWSWSEAMEYIDEINSGRREVVQPHH